MFQIYLTEVTFAQAAKYVIITKTPEQTKRSQVCHLWTSAPTFPEAIPVSSLNDLVIKACSATIDRKLTVIGSVRVREQELELDGSDNVVYDDVRDIVQVVEEREVCVGRCKITVVRKLGNQDNFQEKEIDDQYQLKSQQSQQEQDDDQSPKCQLKFIIHGGFDFYLGTGFRVNITWSKQKTSTKFINNRINPFWAQTLTLQGPPHKPVQLTIQDSKQNKLQWLKLSPKQIRIMYPYHLHLIFREECVGVRPHIYLTVIREDVPLYSILEKKVGMRMRYVGPPVPGKAVHYVLIYPREVEQGDSNRLPLFVDLDMKNYISFDSVNRLIQDNSQKKYEWNNWNLLLPVNTTPDHHPHPTIHLLKSILTKSLTCLYFTLDDPKALLRDQLWNHTTIIDRKEYFENSIKELYYQEKKIVVGKAVEFGSLEAEGLGNQRGAVSLEERWKILTHNYGLRKKMLQKSIQYTQQTKKQINQKGQYLQHLKKVLLQVKKINDIMIQKQKSTLIPQNKVSKKIKDNYMQYPTVEIVSLLLEKQVQLEKRKKINDQMRMRMDSLHYFNEDSQMLDQIVVDNAARLLEQQEKIKQMKKIRQALPKQRQVISKLQKIFQKRQIDKSMNQLLRKQQTKLNQIKKLKNQNLQKVYDIVKNHKKGPASLTQSIKAAEKELISLNLQYAKLTAL